MPKYYVPYQYKLESGVVDKSTYITPNIPSMTETELIKCIAAIRKRESTLGQAHVEGIFIYGFFPLGDE